MSSYGTWLSAAGMKVQEHRQTLLANNLANARTTGFKHDLAVVTQRRVESQTGVFAMPWRHGVLDDMPGGVHVRPPHHSHAQGRIESTGKPLDAAIEGDGFFAVSDGRSTRYTRDGEFTVGGNGELVLSTGGGRWRVLDEASAPIALNPNGQELVISADGVVRQGGAVVGRLGLFASDDEQQLRKVGENLFDAGEATMTPLNGRVVPGAREASNVDVMGGLASMIEASRAYQLNATMIQLQDQLTGRVAQVARPSGT